MLEQEVASIIKFTLDNAGNPSPYYDEIKSGFVFPSCFFPVPEIDTGGDTLSTFRMRYIWFINFFHTTTTGAYCMALSVLEALKKGRNLVPIIDTSGKETAEKMRILDPSAKKIDAGVVQLTIQWDSRRSYDVPAGEYIQTACVAGGWLKGEKYRQPNTDAETETEAETGTDSNSEQETINGTENE